MSDKRLSRNTGLKTLDAKIKTTSTALITARKAVSAWSGKLVTLNEELTEQAKRAFVLEDPQATKKAAELQDVIKAAEFSLLGARATEAPTRAALSTLQNERELLAQEVAETQVKTHLRKIKKAQEKTYTHALELMHSVTELRQLSGQAEKLARDYGVDCTHTLWKNVVRPVQQWVQFLCNEYGNLKLNTSESTFDRRVEPMVHLLNTKMGLSLTKMAEDANILGSSRKPAGASPQVAQVEEQPAQVEEQPAKIEKQMLQPIDEFNPDDYEVTENDLVLAGG